jgi:putative SOS response-associated peptidase YedK
MCARKMMVTDLDKVRQIFGVTAGPTPNFAPRYNLPITERAPIVRLDGDGHRRIELATWDYRDGSVASLKGRPPFYNARAESMGKSEPFAQRRCLLPCDGFYEWLTVTEPGRKTTKKIPFLFRREDRQPFAMGGVWSEWHNPEGGTELTYVELTTAPNTLVGEIHNRMSLIIDPADYGTYLKGSADEARRLIGPNPMVGFERVPVCSKVNSVRNDGPEVIEPPEADMPQAQPGLFA